MSAPTASIYERIGGHEAIFATVDSFYAKIMADDELFPAQWDPKLGIHVT